MTHHLQDARRPDGQALCGARDMRTWSRHELKRGRITCPKCLAAHAAREEEAVQPLQG